MNQLINEKGVCKTAPATPVFFNKFSKNICCMVYIKLFSESAFVWQTLIPSLFFLQLIAENSGDLIFTQYKLFNLIF